jgi:hypothetical protein
MTTLSYLRFIGLPCIALLMMSCASTGNHSVATTSPPVEEAPLIDSQLPVWPAEYYDDALQRMLLADTLLNAGLAANSPRMLAAAAEMLSWVPDMDADTERTGAGETPKGAGASTDTQDPTSVNRTIEDILATASAMAHGDAGLQSLIAHQEVVIRTRRQEVPKQHSLSFTELLERQREINRRMRESAREAQERSERARQQRLGESNVPEQGISNQQHTAPPRIGETPREWEAR